MRLEPLLTDLQDAMRGLSRARRFTAAVCGTVMIGIGATVPLYSAADALLFRAPSGIQSSAHLVELYTSRFTGSAYGPSSYPDFVDLSAASRFICGLAAYKEEPFTSIRVAGASRAFQHAQVSDTFFKILGVEPQAGSLTLSEVSKERPEAVISSELSATTGATVGTVVTVNSVEHVVIGIAPQGFNGLHVGSMPHLWIPLHADRDENARGRRTLKVIGRLCDEISLRDAQMELDSLESTLASAHPDTNRGSQSDADEPRHFTLSRYSRLESAANPQAALVGITLVAATALALLCGCVNACSLLLARAIARQREFAVRVALGAGRARLGRLVLCESVLLSIVGAAGGLVLSFWVARTLNGLLSPEEYALLSPRATVETAVGVVVIASVVGALVGSVPAVSATRFSLPRCLRLESGVGRTTGGMLRLFVVSGQVTISLTFLIGAALCARSLSYAARAGYGFAAETAALITIERSGGSAGSGQQDYQAVILNHLRRMKDVIAVGSTSKLPFSHAARREFRVAQDTRNVTEIAEAAINFVSVGYFRALSVPLLAGRTFEFRDDVADEANVVVNEAFAQKYLGWRAVGRELEDPQGTTLRVIGVVRNEMHRALQGPPEPMVYYPSTHGDALRAHVVVRTSHPSTNRLAEYVRELGSIPGGKVVEVAPFESRVANVLLPERVAALLISACGLSVLLLTVLGVYALAADEIRRRTQEIALRLALGASRLQLVVHLSKSALIPIVAGACLGLVSLFWLLRIVRWVAFFPPIETTVMVAATGLFVSVAVAATMLPVRQVVRINPWTALRAE
ncbi:MAG: ABC transporter permease [Vicinamibacterales bacterium]